MLIRLAQIDIDDEDLQKKRANAIGNQAMTYLPPPQKERKKRKKEREIDRKKERKKRLFF